MIEPGVLRGKYVCAKYGPIVIGALLIVAILAFGTSAWAYTHPDQDRITVEGHHQTIETDVETSAVVSGKTPLWDTGTVLNNSRFYPSGAAPNLTVTVETRVPEDQPVRVAHELAIVYRGERNGGVIWRSKRTLDRETMLVTDGEASSATTIHVPGVRRRIGTLSSAFTGIGTVTPVVRVNVSYRTDRYAGNVTMASPLHVSQNGYWLTGNLAAKRTRSTTVTRTRTVRNLANVLAWAVLGVVSLAGAGAAARFYAAGPDAKELKHRIDRHRCLEWISEGHITQPISDRDIELDTLEGLVDVAIDSNNRVVYDTDRELYAVADLTRFYYFDPESRGESIKADPSGDPRDPNPAADIPAERGGDGRDPTLDDPGHRIQFDSKRPSDPSSTTADWQDPRSHDRESVESIETVSHEFGRERWEHLLHENGNGQSDEESDDPDESRESRRAPDGGEPEEDPSPTGFGRYRWERLFNTEE